MRESGLASHGACPDSVRSSAARGMRPMLASPSEHPSVTAFHGYWAAGANGGRSVFPCPLVGVGQRPSHTSRTYSEVGGALPHPYTPIGVGGMGITDPTQMWCSQVLQACLPLTCRATYHPRLLQMQGAKDHRSRPPCAKVGYRRFP